MPRRDPVRLTVATVPLLTIEEVAQRIGCSIRHVRRLIQSGELVAIDISAGTGRRSMIRVRADEVDRFLVRRVG